MTEGRHSFELKPYLKIMNLVWPLALGMINNAVMQFADRAYLAHYSMEALEAVLPSGVLMFVFAGFFQSLVGYSSVLVGQYFGAGEERRCLSAFRVATYVAIGAGLLSLPLLYLGGAIIRFTASSPSLIKGELDYYNIMMLGAISIYGQMAASSYFTGRGKTRIVFWVNLLGNALNIALDPLLIFGYWGFPELGIIGAAAATVLSMFLQWAILAIAIRMEKKPTTGSAGGEMQILKTLLRFGLPSATFEILNLASFSIFVFVTGGVGAMELAASNACFTVNYLLFAPMMGFSIGAQTLVAQAIGRGDVDGAAKDARRTILLGGLLAFIFSASVLAFANPVLSLFSSNAGEAVKEFHALGNTLLTIMAVWLMFDAIDVIIAGALKGAGDTKYVMTLSIIASFVVWLPIVFLVRYFHNTMPALWMTMILLVLIEFVMFFIRWKRGAWRNIKMMES